MLRSIHDRRELGIQRWIGRKDKGLVREMSGGFFFFLDFIFFGLCSFFNFSPKEFLRTDLTRIMRKICLIRI